MSEPHWSPGYPTIPWAKPGDTEAFAKELSVVIVAEDGSWYGPYDNVGIATKSAWGIATKGDNQKRRTPMENLALVRTRDWPRSHGMEGNNNSHRFAAAIGALRDAAIVLASDEPVPSGFLEGSLYRKPLYHGDDKTGLTELRPEQKDRSTYGIVLSPNLKIARAQGPYLYQCIVNIRKPMFLASDAEVTKDLVKQASSQRYDCVVRGSDVSTAREVVLFRPDQVLIVGEN
jgi:hypothetical protein